MNKVKDEVKKEIQPFYAELNKILDETSTFKHFDESKNQIEATKNGEMAANARLQSALDSLAPTHSYYEYS